jgi:protein involved in temperature-dependent protein secretion
MNKIPLVYIDVYKTLQVCEFARHQFVETKQIPGGLGMAEEK